MSEDETKETSSGNFFVKLIRGDWGSVTPFRKAKKKKPVEESGHKTSSRLSFGAVIRGDIFKLPFIKNNIMMLLLGSIFAFLYIGNRYYCERKIRTIDELEKQLYDVKIDYLTYSSDLMEESKLSNVKERIKHEQINLEESTLPPYSLK